MLYIIATPIGNLKDISLRALEVLKKSDLIICEDTRVTSKLLSRYEIKKPLLSYHQQSGEKKLQRITEELRKGKNVAYVSDGGTPGISDPGGKLVERVSKELPKVETIPIPGPCALIAAASVSGLPMENFSFLGFPPSKKKRQKFFKEALSYFHTVIFYESPHRIIKALEEIIEIENREMVVLREATKIHERIYRGSAESILEELKKESNIRGEFTVIVKEAPNHKFQITNKFQ